MWIKVAFNLLPKIVWSNLKEVYGYVLIDLNSL